MKRFLKLFLLLLLAAPCGAAPAEFLVFEGKSGPGVGKHVVFLSGDEEYRSEEALPQMARILAERHGFKCTVLFAINPATGIVDPTIRTNLPGAEALDSADVIVMSLRFREWTDAQMKHFVDAYLGGKPIIALRTSTHAFNYTDKSASPYAVYSFNSKTWPGGFGKQVLGETWVAHHGAHKKEATRGIIEPGAVNDPLLRGVADLFGNSDVYTANPPADAKILVRGQVLNGMNQADPPVEGKKNDPMQPVVWTRLPRNEAGKTNKILCTTMGAATDLQNEGLRRLLVNAVYWGAGLEVPSKADVSLVGNYRPTMYGFDGYRRGMKPADFVEPSQKSGAAFELKPGEHVAIIGNTLADRFQHSGWFETFIYAGQPNNDLVFRNLAVAGDEVALRHRPDSFGSADEWLKKTQAGMIFAFFGFNESFHGPDGLQKFRADLDKFLKDTAAKNYSGKGPPQVVLFSPIANEKHRDANFPDPSANNANLRAYSQAMREVAEANGVRFVDLFQPSLKLYEEAAARGESLTINGLHLHDAGDKQIAEVLYQSLFGSVPPTKNAALIAKLREAVNDKNAHWHARYRTVDGNNVYGGRSALAYQPGKGGFISDRNPATPYVSNFKVMQEEMSQRDVLTANRDRRVWAVAKGGDLAVDDSNLPPVTKVETNLRGQDAGQPAPFLGGEAAIAKMKVHSGMKVNLFASEDQFPELAKPVQMAWDTRGRLWVAAWPNYPERTPESKVGDSLLIFEDTNGDGKADKCTHFLDDLNAPTGFQFYKDGVLVVQAPDLWFVRDTDGDGKGDWKERVLMGLSSADSHHTANSLCLDPGGSVYLSDGVFHRAQLETPNGPVRNRDGAIYRFEPRTGRFETYVSYDFANPHGRVFDEWGNDLITDGTGNNNYFGPAFSGHLDYPAKHSRLKEFWDRPSRPCAGTGMISSRHFPEEFQGDFLNCNVIGFQGIFLVKVRPDGSGLKGETLESLVSSSDPNFRPTAVDVGPDGAIYFCDWQNPIIGHMQHHLRDPNRDHEHGRIYRITYEGRPLLKAPQIAGQPIPALLELMREPEAGTRRLAKIELGNRNSTEVIAAVNKWSAALDVHDPAYEHLMTEALWIHQWHNVVNPGLLERRLQSPEPRARAAAARVLCYWRDRVPDALAKFQMLAGDEQPRVRLEAVRAASFFGSVQALDVALSILKHPTDYYLDYTLRETLRQLEPWKRKVLEGNVAIASENPAGRAFLLGTIKTPELLALPRSAVVLPAILTRADAADTDRQRALVELAEARHTNRVAVLLEEIDQHLHVTGAKPSTRRNLTPDGLAAAATLSRLFPYQVPEELKAARGRLLPLAMTSTSAELRQNAWAALALADGSFDQVWREASKAPQPLADLLEGIPLLTDSDFRALAYDRVKPILDKRLSLPGVNGVQEKAAIIRGAIHALVSMRRNQEEVFTALNGMIARGEQVPVAAAGLRVIPRAKWPAAQTGPAAQGIVAWARKVPAGERTTPAYGETVQLAADLATFLPAGEAAALRQDLKELRVPFFVIRTVREQMRYDTPRLVVQAGKPFEIMFENADFMPHNLVVVKPGTRESVGTKAATMKPDELDEQGRAYLPNLPDILAGSRMLLTGQRESLKLTAPETEGNYEFVCTFPGHHQVMWGRLIVTKDVDAWLSANPERVMPVPVPDTADHDGQGHKH